MKKLLIILLASFLVACDSKLMWSDVKDEFVSASLVEEPDTFSKQDILDCLTIISSSYENANYGQSEVNEELLFIYKAGEKLLSMTNKSNDINANTLATIATSATELVQACYESKEMVASSKEVIKEKLALVEEFSEADWNLLTVQPKLRYETVKKEYDFIDENYKNQLLPKDKIDENYLIKRYNILKEGIPQIKEGVTANTHQLAKDIYNVACELWIYTKYFQSENADKVYYFMQDTKEYILSRYEGYETELDFEQYDLDFAQLSKLTRSAFNEIAILIKALETDRW